MTVHGFKGCQFRKKPKRSIFCHSSDSRNPVYSSNLKGSSLRFSLEWRIFSKPPRLYSNHNTPFYEPFVKETDRFHNPEPWTLNQWTVTNFFSRIDINRLATWGYIDALHAVKRFGNFAKFKGRKDGDKVAQSACRSCLAWTSQTWIPDTTRRFGAALR